jgi:hypothetical protein
MKLPHMPQEPAAAQHRHMRLQMYCKPTFPSRLLRTLSGPELMLHDIASPLAGSDSRKELLEGGPVAGILSHAALNEF